MTDPLDLVVNLRECCIKGSELRECSIKGSDRLDMVVELENAVLKAVTG